MSTEPQTARERQVWLSGWWPGVLIGAVNSAALIAIFAL